MKKIILALLICVFCSGNLSAQEKTSTAIARVYEQTIYKSDLMPDPRAVERAKEQLSPEELAVFQQELEFNTLAGMIYSALRDQFMEKEQAEPTQAEIESMFQSLQKAQDSRIEQFTRDKGRLLAKLNTPGVTENEKLSIQKNIQVIDKLLQQFKEEEEESKNIENYAEMQAASNRKVAALSVHKWKFNKSLYEKYGGRVIFQQFGLEPIDAYKMFLNEQRDAKAFEILDPAYKDIFVPMYNYFEQPHQYIEKTAADEYFASPWWEKEQY